MIDSRLRYQGGRRLGSRSERVTKECEVSGGQGRACLRLPPEKKVRRLACIGEQDGGTSARRKEPTIGHSGLSIQKGCKKDAV
jgi:hypothetical protein